MVAPAGFFAVMMVLGFVTPGYDWVARYRSELSLGSLGWIMIADFVVLGVVELAFAVALGRVIAVRVSGWLATVAVGLIGAAFVTAGVCVTDPAKLVSGAHTGHGTVHALVAAVMFSSEHPSPRSRRPGGCATGGDSRSTAFWPRWARRRWRSRPSSAAASWAWPSGSPSRSPWPG